MRLRFGPNILDIDELCDVGMPENVMAATHAIQLETECFHQTDEIVKFDIPRMLQNLRQQFPRIHTTLSTLGRFDTSPRLIPSQPQIQHMLLPGHHITLAIQ